MTTSDTRGTTTTVDTRGTTTTSDDRNPDAPTIAAGSLSPFALLRASLAYPLAAPALVRTLLVGGLLIAPAVVVGNLPLAIIYDPRTALLVYLLALVPGVAVLGYYVFIIRHVAAGRAEPPRVDRAEWRDFVVLGSKATVIYLVFLLYPHKILQFIGVAGGPPSQLLVEILPETLGGFSPFVVAIVAILYVYPAAVAHFVDTGRLRDGFNPSLIVSTIASRTYAIGAIVASVITLSTGQLVGWILLIDLYWFGWGTISAPSMLLVGAISFYLGMSLNYVIGRTWAAVQIENGAKAPDETARVQPMSRQIDALESLHARGLVDESEYRAARARVRDSGLSDGSASGLLDGLNDLSVLRSAGLLTDEQVAAKARSIVGLTGESDGVDGPSRHELEDREDPERWRGRERGEETDPADALAHLYRDGVFERSEYARKRRLLRERGGSADRRRIGGTVSSDALETARSSRADDALTTTEYERITDVDTIDDDEPN